MHLATAKWIELFDYLFVGYLVSTATADIILPSDVRVSLQSDTELLKWELELDYLQAETPEMKQPPTTASMEPDDNDLTELHDSYNTGKLAVSYTPAACEV